MHIIINLIRFRLLLTLFFTLSGDFHWIELKCHLDDIIVIKRFTDDGSLCVSTLLLWEYKESIIRRWSGTSLLRLWIVGDQFIYVSAVSSMALSRSTRCRTLRIFHSCRFFGEFVCNPMDVKSYSSKLDHFNGRCCSLETETLNCVKTIYY